MNKEKDILKMSSDELYALLDEIPSDGSEVSESEDECEEIDVDVHNIFEKEEDIQNISDWESDDVLPLTSFVMKRDEIKWTKSTNYSTNVLPFVESVGPNIPDDVEYPVDLFLLLFSQDLLERIVFETNLSTKWWHRIFWHFLDLTVVNAYILYKQRASGAVMKLKDFKTAVATGLIGADPETPQRGRKSAEKPANKFKVCVPLERRTNKAAHIPVHGTKVRCANCSTKAKPHRTRWHWQRWVMPD